jgi:formate/nitrite transporter FocA (FNT family)
MDTDTPSEIREQIKNRALPSAQVVFETLHNNGVHELGRPTQALGWSALAAGMSMGFSLIAEGLIQSHVPNTAWRPLIAPWGYSLGFLVVILGRQQLFTENTLSAILPLLTELSWRRLLNVTRLWATVLSCNMVGALAVAWLIGRQDAFTPEVNGAFAEIGRAALAPGFGTHVLQGLFAGWLIALMVWLMPFAETFRLVVILLLSYVIGLGGFPHIVAGAVEVYYLGWMGLASWGRIFWMFIIPTLAGNVIGGVALVSVINYAQVYAGGMDG